MLGYAETIVRIKHVKENVNEDINSLIVWALGTYPVDSEDYNIEMSLFVPISLDERDLDSQAVFVKDNFFSVGGKIVPGFYEGNNRMMVASSTHITILNRVDASNKSPLKISLIGIPQEMTNEIKGDAIIQTLLEIINNEFYVYAKDVNYIDAQFLNKKNILEISKDKFEDETVASISKSENANKPESSLSNNFYPSKCVRVDNSDDSVQGFCAKGSTDCQDFVESVEENFENKNSVALGSGCGSNLVDGSRLPKQIRTDVSEESFRSFYAKDDGDSANFSHDEEVEGSVKNSSYQKKSSCQKDKKSVGQSLRCNLRSRASGASTHKV
ncbi:hypothetical protein C2G38_2235400 [Gigaspora rosea]|uniref:Uncharacterized protein n=1 Tax=Gigaspora rosea TaxID=44941 RepID=A0A397TZ96_9GLOM|nr:hypothetical protein C2G38_2235400 [Gigaspora rosea]